MIHFGYSVRFILVMQ